MLEKFIFTQGLNSDNSEETITANEYRFALNIHCGITDIGNISNIQGNLLLSFDFPEGVNKCIGGKYDNKTNTIIWFVFNDLGNHQILEYDGNINKISVLLPSELLNFDKNNLITGINIFEGLLYWVDPKPRKINIKKAKLTFNPPSDKWDFFDNAGNFTQFDKKKIGFVSKTPHTFKAGDKVIIVQNEGAVFPQYDGFTSILAVNSGLLAGYPYDITIDKDGMGNTPPNGGYAALSIDGLMPYIAPFKEEYMEAIKYEIPCPPIVAYADDIEKKVNTLKDKLFQFKVRNVFDDNEKAAWSPISRVPYPVIFSKDADTNGKNNVIKVTVNTGSSIATRIEIAAREGNLGDFFLIADLDKDKLCIEDDSTYTYDWYNDGVYNNLEINESNKLYDSVPLLAKAQEIIKGERLVYGDITEGYDAVPIDAKLKVSLQQEISNNTYNIKGNLLVINSYLDADDGKFQPLFANTDTGNGDGQKNLFGGITTVGGGNIRIENGIADDFDQFLGTADSPMTGWVVYLAATDYYGVSTQYISGKEGIGQNPSNFPNRGGIYIIESTTAQRAMEDLIEEGGTQGKNKLYSTFEIKGVPNGTYVLRIAGHHTTQATIDDKSYQTTSSYTMQVGGVTGHECIVVVNGSDVTVGDTWIKDLIDPRLGHHANAVAGTVKEVSGRTIELAEVRYKHIISGSNTENVNLKTDHNGFYFDTGKNSKQIESVARLMGITFDVSGNTPNTDDGKLNVRNLTSTTASQLDNLKTTLRGNIKSSGTNIKGIRVVSSRGGDGVTDIDGNYEVTVYGAETSPNRREGTLYFMLGDGLTGTPPQPLPYYVLIGNGINDFNSTKFPPSASSNAVIVGLITSTSLARGGVYQYGIVYYDYANRSGLTNTFINSEKDCQVQPSTVPTDGLKVTIPYYTEQLKKQLTEAEQTQADLLKETINSGTEAMFAFGSASSISFEEYQLTFAVNDAIASGNTTAIINAQQDAFSAGVSYNLINDKINRANSSAVQYIADATAAGLNISDFITSSNGYKTDTTVNISSPVGAIIRAKESFSLVANQLGNTKVAYNDLTGGDGISGGAAPIVSWELFSVPPIWATHYQWVRTLDTAMNSKLQILADSIIYVKEDRTPSGQPYNDDLSVKIKIGFKNLIEYNEGNSNSQLNYGYTKGDRLRFKKKNNGDFFNDYFDFDIIAFDPAGYIYINNLLALGDLANEAGCEIEIYTPKLTATVQIYYEIGECYEITDAGTENRRHSVTSGQFTSGDVYYRQRTMVYKSEEPNPPSKTFTVEDYNFNDFFPSKVADIGRPNKVDNSFKRINRPSTIFYSQRFIPETNINGLSSFPLENFELFSRQYGSIQYLYSRDTWLHIYQELKVGNVPIEQFYLNNNAGTNVVGVTDKVIDARNMQYYTGEFGIGQHPESFAVYGNSEYFIDVKRGAVLRLSNNGIIEISKYSMYKFFTDLFKEIVEVGRKVNIYGGYDIKRAEYLISIETDATNLKSLPKKDVVLTPEEIIVLKDLDKLKLLDGILKQQGMTDAEIIEFKNKYLV